MTITALVSATPGSTQTVGAATRRLADHEAGHALLAVLGGIDVRSVWIAGIDDDVVGECRVTVREDRYLEHLHAMVAGPIAGGTPLEWKPERSVAGDEGGARALVDKLGLEAVDWLYAHSVVRLTLSRHRVAHVALSNALLHYCVLTGDMVSRLVRGSGQGLSGAEDETTAPDGPGVISDRTCST